MTCTLANAYKDARVDILEIDAISCAIINVVNRFVIRILVCVSMAVWMDFQEETVPNLVV